MAGVSRSRKFFTAQQGQYLAYIHLYTRLHRRSPAETDMQEYFRVSPPSVHQMLLTLERAGFIRRQPSDEERSELTALASRRKTAQALALRARIVLACAEGSENKEVAAGLHVDQGTVGKWRRRFVERRIDGLRDEPRSGTPRTIDDARI